MDIGRIGVFRSLNQLDVRQNEVVELGAFNLVIFEIELDVIQTALTIFLLLFLGLKDIEQHDTFGAGD